MILEKEGNVLESQPEVGKREWDLGHSGVLALIRADRIHGQRCEQKFSSN